MQELSHSGLKATELTLYDLLTPKEKQKKPRRINSIEEWIICFNTYISVVALRDPQRIPDLLAYSSLIVQASKDFQGMPWLAYDTHFRKQAAAIKLSRWGEKDPSIWLTYFTPALAKQRCEECGALDHLKNDCELAEERQRSKAQQPRKGSTSEQGAIRYTPYSSKPPPICKRWNRGSCTSPSCSYRHICMECHSATHRDSNCPLRYSGGSGSQMGAKANAFRPDPRP